MSRVNTEANHKGRFLAPPNQHSTLKRSSALPSSIAPMQINRRADSFQMLLFRAIRPETQGVEAGLQFALPQEEQTQETFVRNSSSLS
ncbi:MAG: hypothetical protein ACKOAD_04950 [Gammaproteobacteria bacterium]